MVVTQLDRLPPAPHALMVTLCMIILHVGTTVHVELVRHVAAVIPTGNKEYPVEQLKVTTCMVVPFVEDTLPKVGALKVGQDFAIQEGAGEDHDIVLMLALAILAHVDISEPVRL